MHALKQVRGVIRAFQTSMVVLLTKIFSNINSKTLTILTKKLILVTGLGPGHVFVDGTLQFLKFK